MPGHVNMQSRPCKHAMAYDVPDLGQNRPVQWASGRFWSCSGIYWHVYKEAASPGTSLTPPRYGMTWIRLTLVNIMAAGALIPNRHQAISNRHVKSYMWMSFTHRGRVTPSLVQVIECCLLVGAKPLPEPLLTYCEWDPREQTWVKLESKYIKFRLTKCIWKNRLQNVGHFVHALMCMNKMANILQPTFGNAFSWTKVIAHVSFHLKVTKVNPIRKQVSITRWFE